MSKITESARNEACTIRLETHCNFDRATTVWAHANGSAPGKGIGMKCNDLLGAYACSACHDVVDRRVPTHLPRLEVELAFWKGHARSVVILIEKGIVVIYQGIARVAD